MFEAPAQPNRSSFATCSLFQPDDFFYCVVQLPAVVPPYYLFPGSGGYFLKFFSSVVLGSSLAPGWDYYLEIKNIQKGHEAGFNRKNNRPVWIR